MLTLSDIFRYLQSYKFTYRWVASKSSFCCKSLRRTVIRGIEISVYYSDSKILISFQKFFEIGMLLIKPRRNFFHSLMIQKPNILVFSLLQTSKIRLIKKRIKNFLSLIFFNSLEITNLTLDWKETQRTFFFFYTIGKKLRRGSESGKNRELEN